MGAAATNSMAQYGQVAYWDERYKNDKEVFDWYQRYEGIKNIITRYVEPDSRVLMVGCGNSRLSEEMYEDNISNITNIDISETCIVDMKKRCVAMENMRCACAAVLVRNMCAPGLISVARSGHTQDVLTLPFNEGAFEAVIDKGTMDSILCGEGSTKNVAVMCKHISRVLKPGGTYIVVSYGQPDYRLNYFDKPEYNWNLLPVQHIAKPCVSAVEDPDPANVHYVYIMEKNK